MRMQSGLVWKGLHVLLCSGLIVGVTQSQSNRTTAISATPRSANGLSYPVMMDVEGRWLLFASEANNLVPGDTNNTRDLFVYDLRTSEIRLLTTGPSGIANGPTLAGAIAADGTVVITTLATNLVPNVSDNNNNADVLVGHVLQGGWRYLSVDSGGRPVGGSSPHISPNGRYAAWMQQNPNQLIVRDIVNNRTAFSADSAQLFGISDNIVFYGQRDALFLYNFVEQRVVWSYNGVRTKVATFDGNLVAYTTADAPQTIRVLDWTRNVEIAQFTTGNASVPPFILSLRDRQLMYTISGQHEGQTSVILQSLEPVDGRFPPPMPITVDESNQFRRGAMWYWPWYPLHARNVAAFSMSDLTPPLVAGDTNGYLDVFVRYLDERITRGVTVGQTATLPNEAVGSVEINFDGQVAVFASPASNLVPNDTNGYSDIFIRTIWRGRPLIGRVLNESNQELNGHSYAPHLSADGRTIVFVTEASNIDPQGPQGRYRVAVFSLANNSRKVIAAANSDFSPPRVSGNGSRIVFATDAKLTRDDTNDHSDIYLYDSATGGLRRLTNALNGPCYEPDISADGNWVAFAHEAQANAPQVYLYHIPTGRIDLVSRRFSAYKPSVNADGTAVAFETTESVPRIYVWRDNTLRLVSVNSFGQPANLGARNPRISHDGNIVAFESDATNLIPMDRTPDTDIFVHDMRTRWTYGVVSTDCTPGNAPSFKPSLSGNGRWVAFQTTATNLSNLPLGANGYAAITQIGCVPPGDVNRDGVVDDSDLLQVLFAFGTDAETCADVNMDGIVDDADLLIVLFTFGTSCQFGTAGGDGASDIPEGLLGESSPVEVEETNDMIVYRTTSMTPAYVKSLERQAAEIEMMHRGLWPYPVAGRGSDPWIQAYGDPLTMSPEELQALLDYFNDPLRYQSEGGDFAPASGHTYTYTQTKTVQQGGNDVNISLNGSIYFHATCQQGGKVEAEAKGDASIKFFSLNYKVAEAYGKASATNAQATVHAYLKIAGQTRWSYGPASQNLSWTYASQCHYGGDKPNIGPFTRSFDFEKTWWLGPVPVKVRAGINLEAGACYKLHASLVPVKAEARFRPYVRSSAFANGGVAFSIVCSASAGVGVSLTLLNDTLEAYATLELGTQNNRCCVFLNAGIYNQITALAGRFYIYAEACCWGLSGPKCGWGRKQQRWEHDLFRWNGYNSSGHLWGPWSYTHCF